MNKVEDLSDEDQDLVLDIIAVYLAHKEKKQTHIPP
jgi:hypothetical protein